jgi:7SK snRNA methylphosphate capping enzyme
MNQQETTTVPEAREAKPRVPSTPALTPNQIDKLRHEAHRHGNYTSYYTFRSQNVPDPRLTQLKTFVQGRRILDLGCNAGKLTLELATHFAASQVVGVDLDTGLIASACKAKQTALSEGKDVENVTFEEFDFANTWPFQGTAAGQWDVIMLLSVVKWLHLNNSDAVLVELFRRLFKIVVPGGFLVLEPQDWANYKRAAKKCPSLRESFKKLELRPPFTETLVAGGWEEVDGWERDEFGFERSVRIWRKPA